MTSGLRQPRVRAKFRLRILITASEIISAMAGACTCALKPDSRKCHKILAEC